MRKALSIFLVLSTLLSAFACETLPTPEDPQEEPKENTGDQGDNQGNGDDTPDYRDATSKTLVVYFSYTGNCRDIVSSVTGHLEADVMEIKPAVDGQDYAANNYKLGADLINAINAKPGEATSYPGIKAIDRNAADYETIIIVTPLWHSHMAAFMQTYLFKYGAQMAGKNVGLIVSSHSSGISSVVADANRLLPNATFMGEALWINQSNRSKQDELVKNWFTGLNLIENTMPGQIKITVSGKTLPVSIESNDATKALVAALREASITYEARDYGGFEKVGALGRSLPTSDTQITTQAGDVILYSGNQIVLFYGSNTWSYTRLGKIQYDSLDELKSFLKAGEGNISVTLSL
jgi:flavodoxin